MMDKMILQGISEVARLHLGWTGGDLSPEMRLVEDLRLDQPAKALDYFERALAVNPNMDGVSNTVDLLRVLLREQRKNAI